MSVARRGQLWLIDLGEPLGHEQGWHRPALVVSADEWNAHANIVTVLPLTRTKHGLPTRVDIEPSPTTGLSEASYARCEDIRSVSDARFARHLGNADFATMHLIGRVLRTFLAL